MAWIIFIFVVLTPDLTFAEGTDVEINLRLKEFDGINDINIVENTIRYGIQDIWEIERVKNEIKSCLEKVKLDFVIDKITRLELSFSPFSSSKYVQRNIKLRQLPEEKNDKRIERNITLFFIDRNLDPDYEIIDKAVAKFNDGGEERRRYAPVFEYANTKLVNHNSQYGVKVRYNYSQVLLEYCKEGFDCCDHTIKLCSTLADEFDSNQFFKKEKISKDRLLKCADDAKMILKLEKEREFLLTKYNFKKIEAIYKLGGEGYKEAGDILKKFCDNFDEYQKLSNDNGKPKYSVCGDAGVSYLKYADFLNNSNNGNYVVEKRSNYENSIKYLNIAISNGDNNHNTIQNLELAKKKLEKL